MILKKLNIHKFRNYENASLMFDNGIQVIVGNNGQGKTNLLESVYYLSCTKSHRVKYDKDLIHQGDTFFNLEGEIVKNKQKVDIRCYVHEHGKTLFLYRNPILKVSEYIGFFNAVMFCPDDMNLFSSTPKVRRRFIDLELGKLSKTYTTTLTTYYRLLKERNLYLKKAKIDNIYLDTLNDQMIDLQVLIIKQRINFLNDILGKSNSFYKELSEDDSHITYEYVSDIDFKDDDSMKQEFKKKYQKTREKDIFLKQTSIGIHKDDFIFFMNEKEISKYASQGQKRTLLLSLKLGIVYTIFEIKKDYPVLILDDVFSELDEDRRKKLLYLLPSDIQIFISTTDVIEIESDKNITYWNVNNGKCELMRRN